MRRIVFITFVAAALTAAVFAFWLFSRMPGGEQIQKTFPGDSYQLFLEGSETTVYTLETGNETPSGEVFRGYNVKEQTTIRKRDFSDLVKRAILNDIANAFDGSPACFIPRHGVRISDGKNTLDLLICYECTNLVSFYGDEKGGADIIGTSKVLLDQVIKDSR